MTAQEAYDLYIALKLHFTTNYDYFKYNGKTKSRTSISSRKDQYQFTKLARQYSAKDLKGLFISNFVAGKAGGWSGYFNSQEAKDIYLKWLKGVQSFDYVIREESTRMKSWLDTDNLTLQDLLAVKDGQHPTLLKLYYGGAISLETLIVYASVFKFVKKWDKEIAEDVVWPDTKSLVYKYRPFLTYDVQVMKQIIKEVWL